MTHSDWTDKALDIREALQGRPREERVGLFQELPETVRKKALTSPYILGRDKQVEALTSDADTILMLMGRGAGKNWTGAHWLLDRIERGHEATAVAAETAADVRDDMVDPPRAGDGLLDFARQRELKPNHKISQSRIELKAPHGSARIQTYSGDSPDSLRGFSGSAVWIDELAKMRYQKSVKSQAGFVLREGGDKIGSSQLLITTTPRPTPTIKELVEDDSVHVIHGTSWENEDNLDDRFLRELEKLEGTRLGRQEIGAQILDDSGDLWSHDDIQHVTPDEVPELVRIVIGLDPSVSNSDDSDECGIVVCGMDAEGNGYVLEDLSGNYDNRTWAALTVAAFRGRLEAAKDHIDDVSPIKPLLERGYDWPPADTIFAERNQGGGLIEETLRGVNKQIAYNSTHTQRSKKVRAEPVHSLFQRNPEHGTVYHVGVHAELEDQMTSFLHDSDSPDRVDAMTYSLTELLLDGEPAGRVSSASY